MRSLSNTQTFFFKSKAIYTFARLQSRTNGIGKTFSNLTKRKATKQYNKQ